MRFITAALAALLLLAPAASAQQAVRINDKDAEKVLKNIERDADAFRKSLADALDKSRMDGRRIEDVTNERIKAFEVATDRLRKEFGDGKPAIDAASEVLQRAVDVDGFMEANALTPAAQGDWARLRADLDMLAMVYDVRWDWNGGVAVARMTDDDVRGLLRRVDDGASAFRKELDTALDRSRMNGTREEDQINSYVKDFAKATDRWRERFGDKTSASADAGEVLRRANVIDDFMMSHALTPEAQTSWARLRETLDEVARGYSIAWDWTR